MVTKVNLNRGSAHAVLWHKAYPIILILKYWSRKTMTNKKMAQRRNVTKLNFRLTLFFLENLKIKKKRKPQKSMETVYNPIPSDKPNLPSSLGPKELAIPAKNL
ncbi:MAG: hypothetical protein Aureis2KO_08530 [Aureisphaera sp.]